MNARLFHDLGCPEGWKAEDFNEFDRIDEVALGGGGQLLTCSAGSGSLLLLLQRVFAWEAKVSLDKEPRHGSRQGQQDAPLHL
jgi:hypothetical protein